MAGGANLADKSGAGEEGRDERRLPMFLRESPRFLTVLRPSAADFKWSLVDRGDKPPGSFLEVDIQSNWYGSVVWSEIVSVF